jgi:hypothetical protein
MDTRRTKRSRDCDALNYSNKKKSSGVQNVINPLEMRDLVSSIALFVSNLEGFSRVCKLWNVSAKIAAKEIVKSLECDFDSEKFTKKVVLVRRK